MNRWLAVAAVLLVAVPLAAETIAPDRVEVVDGGMVRLDGDLMRR